VLHTQEVTGSSPVAPTIRINPVQKDWPTPTAPFDWLPRFKPMPALRFIAVENAPTYGDVSAREKLARVTLQATILIER
jgi:hypothetical protein